MRGDARDVPRFTSTGYHERGAVAGCVQERHPACAVLRSISWLLRVHSERAPWDVTHSFGASSVCDSQLTLHSIGAGGSERDVAAAARCDVPEFRTVHSRDHLGADARGRAKAGSPDAAESGQEGKSAAADSERPEFSLFMNAALSRGVSVAPMSERLRATPVEQLARHLARRVRIQREPTHERRAGQRL